MTSLLEQAFREAEKLPPEEQDRLASAILAELDADRRWETAFERSQDVLGRLAERARNDYASGDTLPLGDESD